MSYPGECGADELIDLHQRAIMSRAPNHQPSLAFAVAPRVQFTRELLDLTAIHLESPYQFWMIPKENRKKCFQLSEGDEELQVVMRTQSRSLHLPPEGPTEGKMYVVRDKFTREWYRVRLLKWDKETEIALVFFVDYYRQSRVVRLASLREMPEGMEGMLRDLKPVPVYRCHLYDVMPSSGRMHWTLEACSWFKKQFVGNCNGGTWKNADWKVLVMSWNEEMVGEEQVVDVGVVLFPEEPSKGSSLNWHIVQAEHALALGIGASSYKDAFPKDLMPSFSSDSTNEIPPWLNGPFPQSVANSWAQILPTQVQGPDMLYATVLKKRPELDAMTAWLRKNLSCMKKLEAGQLEPMCPVLVRREGGEISRAVVVTCKKPSVEEELNIKVLLVDVGVQTWTRFEDLTKMPKWLVNIPAFIQRFHIRNLVPNADEVSSDSDIDTCDEDEDTPRAYQWTPYECSLFADLFGRHVKEEEPLYFAFVREVLELKIIDQPLDYDLSKKTWSSRRHLRRKNVKVPRLARNYYYSIGIELMYCRRRDGQGITRDRPEEQLDVPACRELRDFASFLVTHPMKEVAVQGRDQRLDVDRDALTDQIRRRQKAGMKFKSVAKAGNVRYLFDQLPFGPNQF